MEVALKSYKWVDGLDPTQKASPSEAPCSAKKCHSMASEVRSW